MHQTPSHSLASHRTATAGTAASIATPSALPPPPLPTPPSRTVRPRFELPTGPSILVGIVTVAVLLAMAAALAVTRARAAWDERVQFAVDVVQERQGEPFAHSVPVDFLTAGQFDEELAGAAREDEPADVLADPAALRALGLARGPLDVNAARAGLERATTAVHYDQADERLLVRGTDIDLAVQAGLVRELTRAWQDQHHGLRPDDDAVTGTRDALRAIVAGDARNSELAWVDTLRPADRRSYDELIERVQQAAAPVQGAGPAVLGASATAPALLGGSLLQGLESSGGVERVHRAVDEPPATTHALVDPWTVLDGTADAGRAVDAPGMSPGQDELRRDTLGALGLYLTLAERIDPSDALAAADAWAGDSYRLTRWAGSGGVCLNAKVAGRDAAGAATLQKAFLAWSRSLPGAQVGLVPDGAAFLVCDPGESAVAEVADRSDRTIALPVVRSQVWADELAGGATPEDARCVAETFSAGLTFAELSSDGPLSDSRLAELRSAVAQRCDMT